MAAAGRPVSAASLREPAAGAAMGPELARLLLKQDVEDFLYREAELLDERRYEDWLELLADDVRYWMPMRRNVPADAPEREFTREGEDVNWFDEGKETLTRRVQQIRTGVHWAEQPPSRLCHMITNVQKVLAPTLSTIPSSLRLVSDYFLRC